MADDEGLADLTREMLAGDRQFHLSVPAWRRAPSATASRKALDEWFEARSRQLVVHAETERTVEADASARQPIERFVIDRSL